MERLDVLEIAMERIYTSLFIRMECRCLKTEFLVDGIFSFVAGIPRANKRRGGVVAYTRPRNILYKIYYICIVLRHEILKLIMKIGLKSNSLFLAISLLFAAIVLIVFVITFDRNNKVSNKQMPGNIVSNSINQNIYSISTDETTGVTTVNNIQYSFTFNVPRGWEIKDSNNSKYISAFDPIALAQPSDTDLLTGMKLEVVVEPLLTGETFQSKVDNAIAQDSTIYVTRKEDVTINNVHAVRIFATSSLGNFELSFIDIARSMVRVIGYIAEQKDLMLYQDEYSSILNSFSSL